MVKWFALLWSELKDHYLSILIREKKEKKKSSQATDVSTGINIMF